jgi:hypothetical protein
MPLTIEADVPADVQFDATTTDDATPGRITVALGWLWRHLALVARGNWTAWRQYRYWRMARRLDAGIAAEADTTKLAALTAEQERLRGDRAVYAHNRLRLLLAALGGGWLPMMLALGIGLWLSLRRDRRTPDKDLICVRRAMSTVPWAIASVIVSGVLAVANGLLAWWVLGVGSIPGALVGAPPIFLTWTVLTVLGCEVALAVSTWSDGTLEDQLAKLQQAPAEPETDDATDGSVVRAITASEAKLAKDASLTVVAPGVTWPVPGKVWTVTVDTGGPTAQPIIDAVDDIASRLNLDESRCFIERRPGIGRRVTITGVEGDPFGEPSRSPLMDMPTVDLLRDGLPWGTDWMSSRVTLQVVFRNFLIGGSPDAGKSTAGHPFHAGFALSARSKLWVCDGGRVDTARLRDAGLTHRWVANDPEAVRDVLLELNTEADLRQEMLDEFGARNVGMGDKVTREFLNEYDIDLDLFWWDEFASHMRCTDVKLAKEIGKLSESVLQRIRKLGIVAALATQSPSSIVMSTDGRDVISDRIALACRTREMSDKITGGMASDGVNAKRLNPAQKRAWLSTAEGNRIVRADYLNGHDLAVIYQRAAALRSASGAEPVRPQPPRVLVELHRMLSDPSRGGRMLTVEVAAAMRAYGIVEVTPADRQGAKTDEQIAQEKVAALVRPFGVIPRPDRDAGNRAAYWLTKEHRDLGEVGVEAAIAKLTAGKPVGLRGPLRRASGEASDRGSRGIGLHSV